MKQQLFALSLGLAAFAQAMVQARAADLPPAATGACGQRADVVLRLAETYGETRRGAGLAGADAVMELYTSAPGRTWTLAVTGRDGLMCLVASGRMRGPAPGPAAQEA